jgi:hypothetical protein
VWSGRPRPGVPALSVRQRSHALVGGSLLLLLILAAVTVAFVRVRPMGVSIGVHSYQRQGDELFACLVLTNTGAVSLAVPLRFGCQVDRASGVTNYIVGTRHEVWLQPRQHVILSNALWLVSLPADMSAWRVNFRTRPMSGRERFVDALRQTGLVNYGSMGKLLGQPRKEADYQWLECESRLLEIPDTPLGVSGVAGE